MNNDRSQWRLDIELCRMEKMNIKCLLVQREKEEMNLELRSTAIPNILRLSAIPLSKLSSTAFPLYRERNWP